MSILEELKKLASGLDIPSGAIRFEQEAPETYLVFTPLYDELVFYADNLPLMGIEEVRISLFTKKNYSALKNRLIRLLLEADFSITEARFQAFEDETGYYHYSLDVAKENVR